jgi:hypothetical protein
MAPSSSPPPSGQATGTPPVLFSSRTEIERKSWSSWKLSEILFAMLILKVVIWRYIEGSIEMVEFV